MRLLFVLLPGALFALTDLGTMGKTYAPSEPDMLERFEKHIRSIDTDDLRKKAIGQVEAAKRVDADIPKCVASRTYEEPYAVTLRQDLRGPDGRIHRRGERVALRAKLKKTLCVIDAGTPEALSASISAVTKEGSCDKTMVSGASVDTLYGTRGLGGIYPYNGVLAEALEVKCYPARVTVEGGTVRHFEYKILR